MMTRMDKTSQFRKELHALLAKYDATLGVHITGDTHGVSEEFFLQVGNEPQFVVSPFQAIISAGDLADT